jgi:hypothetical protein
MLVSNGGKCRSGSGCRSHSDNHANPATGLPHKNVKSSIDEAPRSIAADSGIDPEGEIFPRRRRLRKYLPQWLSYQPRPWRHPK